jgi:uncharacterized RDD family membrane protein YckC
MEPVTLSRRFRAGFYTPIIWWLSSLPTAVTMLLLFNSIPPDNAWLQASVYALIPAQIICELLFFAYFRASVGMMLLSQRFCGKDYEEISWARCFWRLMIGWLLFPLLPLTWILILLDDERRTPADRLAGVRVINIVKLDRRQLRGFPVIAKEIRQ